LISDRLGEGRGSFLSIDEIENVPLLQISLPVNFEKWDGEKPILVAYTPLTIDDMEWEDISAYDSEGNEHVLDAKTPPDFPVMVVGINERCDKNGTPLFIDTNLMYKEKALGENSIISNSSLSGYYLKINKLKMEASASNYESWTNGTHAEFFWIIRDNGGHIYRALDYGDDGISHRVWTWNLWEGFRTDKSWQTHNHLTEFNATDYYNWYGPIFIFDMWEYDVSSSNDPMGRVEMNFPYANIKRSTYYSIDYSFEYQ